MQEENFANPTMNACHYTSAPDGQLYFILHLKFAKGLLDIAHNIYTGWFLLLGYCLNRPLGGPEVGREGTTCRFLLRLYVF